MNKRDFLKSLGLLGIGSVLPSGRLLAASDPSDAAVSCTLIPSETAGPFPLDLTANTYYFRQDIRESQAGVQLNVKLRIVGTDNCGPMQNVRVNIWHCDKDGVYSGYNVANNPGDANAKHLRGYQMTDANGEVEFITIFPGWYNGRITHIHFQVYVSTSYAVVSQFSFDIAAKNALYQANSTLYPKGTDPQTFAGDNIFSDGYSLQLGTLTPNTSTGGYDSFLEVAVQGAGTVDVGHIEKENAKHFVLGQNYPNPHAGATTIPVELLQPADVTLAVYDLQGREVYQRQLPGLDTGDHAFALDLNRLNLAVQSYLYQITVVNAAGRFTACKHMMAAK